MESKKVKKVNKKNITSRSSSKKTDIDVNFDSVEFPKKPINKTVKSPRKKKQNSLYKEFNIDKDVADRINFDDSYNKEKKTKGSYDFNFIPNEVLTIPKQTTKLIVLIIVSCISFLSIIFCFIALFFYRDYLNKSISSVVVQNKNLDSIYEQKKQSMNDIKILNEDVYKLDTVYSNHKYWTKFFSFLELNTLSDVYYKDIFIDSGNNISITAVTNNYSNVAKQIDIFKKSDSVIKNIISDGASKKDDSVYSIEFKLLLEIDNSILLKDE